MPKLNQIIAIEKSVKSQSLRELTDAHKTLQKESLLAGIARTYRPKDDEGEQYPPESTRVQVRVGDLINQTVAVLTKLFDVTATKDWANGNAKADVVVGGTVLLKDVPVTYLLFLEKQLTDLHTFISKLPTLDPSEVWSYDEATDAWATDPVSTNKTKRIPRNHLKAEATKEHPAQVEVYYEDITVGNWQTIKYSGAMPASRVAVLKERVRTLQEAVKFAREEANSTEVDEQNIGETVFNYIFAE
ncbi:MAG: hypothetical protein Phog2KO_38530 [Phototrophicaceae bacterium]